MKLLFLILCIITLSACLQHQAADILDKKIQQSEKNTHFISGYFRGWKQSFTIDQDFDFDPVEEYHYFPTMESCESWLKHMNFYFNDRPPDASLCTQY